MKTRTLLLLALGCGTLIMVAGAVFLFQLAGQDEPDPPIAVGEHATVGDMTVTVLDATEQAGVLDVTVRIGGVDDADGSGGFRLIAGGQAVVPARDIDGDSGGGCGPTAIADTICTVRFDVSAVDGSSRVLVYTRGDEQARWMLP